jgi:hypothetical protein
MGEYEELKAKVEKQYRESSERFQAPGPGFGDEKRRTNNEDMATLKAREVKTLEAMQGCAPPSERPKVDDALARTRQEAQEFATRAAHYARKLGQQP